MTAYRPNVLERVALICVITTFGLLPVFGGQTIYFLVGPVPWFAVNLPVLDSYVLPLSEQTNIDHARYLIAAGWSLRTNDSPGIVGALCVTGGDDVNCNYYDPRFPSWSWHVSQFLEFANYSAEILDGSPSATESLVAGAPPGQQFEIGYWGYTVVQELGPAPLRLSITPQGGNLEFFWSAPGTNYVYTLEGSESVSGTNWSAVPGASWPLNTNHWTMPRANAPARFFRVRSEGPT